MLHRVPSPDSNVYPCGKVKKGKGDVGVEKEREKGEQKGEKMENFFCLIYEFLTDAEKFDVTNEFPL